MARSLCIVAAICLVGCTSNNFSGSEIRYEEEEAASRERMLREGVLDGADGEGTGGRENEADGQNSGDEDDGGTGNDGASGSSNGGNTGGGKDGESDGGNDGDDDGDIVIDPDGGGQSVSRPKSDIGPFSTFCSNNGTKSAGGNVQSTSGVGVKVYDSSGSVVLEIDDSDEMGDIRDELVNTRSFETRAFGKVEDGTYYLTLCTESSIGSCNASQKFLNTFSRDIDELEDAPRGVIGVASNVVVRNGKVSSTGRAAMMMPNNGNKADCDETNSPLIVDFGGDGIKMLAPLSGPQFDIDADGRLDQVSWPKSANTMFLAYDRNGNGNIDSGNELFGNHTTGPDGVKASNGFAALAKYDDNGDGVIDSQDAIFADLLLWSDANFNGTVEEGELFTLAEKGLVSIDLNYIEAFERDVYGNETRQRSTVKLQGEHGVSELKRVFDIWFRTL